MSLPLQPLNFSTSFWWSCSPADLSHPPQWWAPQDPVPSNNTKPSIALFQALLSPSTTFYLLSSLQCSFHLLRLDTHLFSHIFFVPNSSLTLIYSFPSLNSNNTSFSSLPPTCFQYPYTLAYLGKPSLMNLPSICSSMCYPSVSPEENIQLS